MMFPDSKNVIYIIFLLRLNFSTIKSGLPDFYRVKLDIIGIRQKPHFLNRETSYSNTLYLVSEGENIALLPIVKNYRVRDLSQLRTSLSTLILISIFVKS